MHLPSWLLCPGGEQALHALAERSGVDGLIGDLAVADLHHAVNGPRR